LLSDRNATDWRQPLGLRATDLSKRGLSPANPLSDWGHAGFVPEGPGGTTHFERSEEGDEDMTHRPRSDGVYAPKTWQGQKPSFQRAGLCL
jgi:hypothetical protein